MEVEPIVQDVAVDSKLDTVEEIQEAVEVSEKPVAAKENEYAYLDATGFTSERFKIEVRNLPKHYGINELKKLLNVKLGLSTNKIKVLRPGCPFLFVCFRDDTERQTAIKTLDGFAWKGKTLQAFEAKPAPDPLVKRRNEASGVDGTISVKKRKTLEETVTALAHLNYEDQLVQKQSEVRNILTTFGGEIWKTCPSLRGHVEAQRKKYDGMPCQLETIRESPQTDGYRNKCEFSVGKNAQGETRVGFRVGSYSNGFIEVESPENLKNISDKMKATVKIFEEYVHQSKYEVYSPETYLGYFRQLTIRTSSSTGEVMVVVGIHQQSLDKEELKELKQSIVACFTSEKAKEVGISSVYFERIEKRKPGQNVNQIDHLHGETHIVDSIHGLKFRISPLAFFQINTLGAEVLYKCAIELAEATIQTSVLDICCGTGTIGLCFAKYCKQVLGVEIIPQAIEDAKYNAELNGIENCKFFCGNADDLITSLIKNAKIQPGENLVAIVDPPRAGLHIRSITQLRNARGLNRLVYVSCSPRSAIKNWVDLMRPCSKAMRGVPFVAKKAMAVDMFPHSPHVELVVLFEREPEKEELCQQTESNEAGDGEDEKDVTDNSQIGDSTE
ncbi:tRNA (uracil-5-)-methyltransferase homolog A [Topomyia yanbarensis]|uniref:tRNA (uracil-5-)-methyltransferase homolog A n=1 Tax=Topomyia yanbarensis TaxID=2498891 RepID=UPI00273AC873|nr:tRNA (uracil-5-)-methyltransferase homolog A [Topomyia yanbarensis]